MPKFMKQPYNVNPQGARKVTNWFGDKVQGFIADRSRTTQKLLDHELRIREHAVKTGVETAAKKRILKATGKQQRKNIGKQGKTDIKLTQAQGSEQRQNTMVEGVVQRQNMSHTVLSAGQLKAKPGTRAVLTPDRAEFTKPSATVRKPAVRKPTTTAAASKPAKPAAAKSTTTRAPRSK